MCTPISKIGASARNIKAYLQPLPAESVSHSPLIRLPVRRAEEGRRLLLLHLSLLVMWWNIPPFRHCLSVRDLMTSDDMEMGKRLREWITSVSHCLSFCHIGMAKITRLLKMSLSDFYGLVMMVDYLSNNQMATFKNEQMHFCNALFSYTSIDCVTCELNSPHWCCEHNFEQPC